MEKDKTKEENKFVLPSIGQHWVLPFVTAIFGLFSGIVLSMYNSDLSENRYFLEKRVIVADNIANEFSTYVVNWSRLIELRKKFNSEQQVLSSEERENFKRTVFARSDARAKLFSSLDSAHLYYSDGTSALIASFQEWDRQQAILTIDKLPDSKEWRTWQIRILRQLRKEISNE